MAAHAYWRINITAAGTTNTFMTVEELQFFDASGTSLATGGTASSSSVVASFEPAKAFDANFTTYYMSNQTPGVFPCSLSYQFPAPVDPATMRLTWSQSVPQAPKTFTIDYSDNGTSWTTVKTLTNVPWDVRIRSLSFRLDTGAGYVNLRAVVTATQSGTSPAGAEAEFHATVGGADLTVAVPQYAINNDGGGSDYASLFDNNTSTEWLSGLVVASGPYNGQALSIAATPVEVMWRAAIGGNYTKSPSSLKMQGSNDGITWTDIGTVTFATWTTAGQVQTVAVVGAAPTGKLLIHPGLEGGMRPLLQGGMNA